MSDEHLEWYYVSTAHASVGPVRKADMKSAFQRNEVTDECLCWNETMANWTAIKDVAGLLDYLKPKATPVLPPVPAKAAFRPPNFAAAAAASVNASQVASSSPSPVVSPNSPASPLSPMSPKVDPVQPKVTKAIPAPPAGGEKANWVELKTPEGLFYYYNKVTKATTWDKPDCLKSMDEMDKDGEWVWMPHTEWGFVPAKRSAVKYTDNNHHLETEDGQQHTVPGKVKLDPLNWLSLRRPVQDLVMLDDMNMPLILHALKTRFQKNDIYTNVGTILISVNPYKRLPLYTPSIIETYRRRGNKTMPPHVYLIADQAYTGLIETGVPQSIVISGESGAGKTECTKQALQYLADVAGSSTSNVEQKILASNPILEAFGNAKTVRNNNSSRFGKYVEINFDNNMQITGSTNTNYLLEKIRVVKQSQGERNYHAFYQLCRGATAENKKQFHLGDVSDYFYLNQSGCDTVEDMDDVYEHQQVLAAMRELGWSEQEINDVYRVTAGVLHLGNVRFESTGDRACQVTDQAALSYCTELLKIDKQAFHKAVTTRVMRVTGQADIDVSLGKAEAEAARDALAKFIYEKLFDWIVERINISIGRGTVRKTTKGNATISILDIFGFEIFEHNQFEQLCINYTNEKLQQFFNQHTFKKEEEVYCSEGIQFTHVEYIDNQPVLDLIEQRPSGVLPLVDEEIKMPRGSDKTFIDKLANAQQKHPHFKTYLKNKEMFIIQHYAGTVLYDSNGFLEKNRDQLNDDAYGVVMQSQLPFLVKLFSAASASVTGGKKATLGSKFSKQLTDLMTALNQTEPHYIRCVKPNPNKAPLEFHPVMVLEQLTYSGVFEAVKIRKSGYPFRYTHADFYQRFRCVLPQAVRYNYSVQRGNIVEGCKYLLQELKQTSVQIGKTRVLYRATHHLEMELLRNVAVEALVIKMQSAYRGWYCRRLRKRLMALKPLCIKALQTKDVAVIEDVLGKCHGCGYEFFEYKKLQTHHFNVLEEKRIEKELLAIIDSGNVESRYEELCKILACSEEIGADNPVIVRCRKVVREIEEKKRAVEWLSVGVELVDEEKLLWALGKVDEYKIIHHNTAEARRVYDKIQAEKPILAELQREMGVGGYINDGDTIVIPGLQGIVERATSFQMITAHGIKLYNDAVVLLHVRTTLAAARGTKDKALWRAVADACGRAGGELAQHAEVQKACDEVAHQAEVDEVTEKLEVSVKNRDQEPITFGIDQCVRLKVNRTQYPIVDVAIDILAKIIEADKLVADAMSRVDEDALVYAVKYSEDFAYEKPHVSRCRELRNVVLQLQSDAEYALEMLEEEPLREIIARADAIRYDTPAIQQCKTWILNTSEEKFIQEQLKRAVKMQDDPRRIRCTIRLKELVFNKMGAMFELDNYIRLRKPVDWAERKLLCLNREKLTASCRVHTTDIIHTSLTEHEEDPMRSDMARKMFKNVCGIMGDRNYGNPLTLTQELLRNCLQDPWLRDEVYCQIIKQLTNNNGTNNNSASESIRKGWGLLACCLETFPPQPEFENYLGWWLKNKAPAGQTEKYVTLYHIAVYSGCLSDVPNEMELQRIISGNTLRQVNYTAVRPYTPPTVAIPGPGQAAAHYAQFLAQRKQKEMEKLEQDREYAQKLQSLGGTEAVPKAHKQLLGGGATPAVPTRPGAAAAVAVAAAAPEEDYSFVPPPPMPSAPVPELPLPPGWHIAHTDDGTPYFYSDAGETTWDRPTA